MSKAEFIPAQGEQLSSVYSRGLTYKGKNNKIYDMKYWTKDSHFEHDTILQSCFYGIEGVGKQLRGTDVTFREFIKYPKDKTFVSDSVDGEETIVIRKKNEKNISNIRIKDFVDNILNNKKEIGENGHEFLNNNEYEIITIDNNFKLSWKGIKQVIRHKVNKKSLDIETIGGKRIKVTEDHSIIQLKDINTLYEVKGKDLIKNNYIISYDKINLEDIDIKEFIVDVDYYKEKIKFKFDINKEELIFLGYLIGDGHLADKNTTIGISGCTCFNLKKLLYFITKKYNCNIKYDKNGHDSIIASKKLNNCLRQLGFCGYADTKSIPDWIINLPKEKIGYFLNGYFSSDGTILIGKTNEKKDSITGIGIGSVSKKLIQDTKLLLDKLGIKYNNGYNKERWTYIYKKYYISKESWNLTIYDTNSIKLFKKYIGFTHYLKKEKLKNGKIASKSKMQQGNLPCNIVKEYCKFGNQDFIDKKRVNHKIVNSDIGCYRIKNIRISNFLNEYVYDLSVEDVERFLCSGVLVHNSGGFQIASFKKRGEVCNIKPIDSLRWQEANADIAMNLDIPPTLGEQPTYEEFNSALNQSVENFKLFEKERVNYKMKLYNVIHGETLPLINLWYDKVKDFKFDGYAIGMKPPFSPMLQAFGFLKLWSEGVLDNNKQYGIHFFGTSGKWVVPTITYIASKLDKTRVTYDSSSYNIGSIYRTYYLPLDIGPHLSFGGKFAGDEFLNRQAVNPNLKQLPCQCPVCESIKDIGELNKSDIYAGTLISLHNMYQYVYYNNILNKIVNDYDIFMDYIRKIGNKESAIKSIEFINSVMYDKVKEEKCTKGKIERTKTTFGNIVEDINTRKENFKKAIIKYDKWLIPQQLNKSKQIGLEGFGK